MDIEQAFNRIKLALGRAMSYPREEDFASGAQEALGFLRASFPQAEASGELVDEIINICDPHARGEMIGHSEAHAAISALLASRPAPIAEKGLREADPRFIDLAMGVLKTEAEFQDDPNGPYSYHCPLCFGRIEFGGEREAELNGAKAIQEIEHSPDCPWVIANALSSPLLAHEAPKNKDQRWLDKRGYVPNHDDTSPIAREAPKEAEHE
jgi:hypothetical protein